MLKSNVRNKSIKTIEAKLAKPYIKNELESKQFNNLFINKDFDEDVCTDNKNEHYSNI